LIKPVLKSLIGVGKAEPFKITPLRVLMFGLFLGATFLFSIFSLIFIASILA